MLNNCLLNVEFTMIIDLKIGSDLNIVVCVFFKGENKAHLKLNKCKSLYV